MERQKEFRRAVFKIALPVTLQSLLQSSFSVIDQVMIGQLGSSSIAGIGLGGKFASIYSVVLSAIASAAGIMISQYMGAKKEREVGRSFFTNLALSIGLAAVFLVLCTVFPQRIMGIYTKDDVTGGLASDYIRILSLSFLPMAVSSIVTTMLRCMEAASLPLLASIFALLMNTGLNYMLIFGKGIFPAMGVKGAASATVAAQVVSCGIILLFFRKHTRRQQMKLKAEWNKKRTTAENAYESSYRKQYMEILCPMLVCEFLWSLGENIYTAVYGNLGTDACAAMTMTIPVQTLVIGALSGLSQASGILIGKSLGRKNYDQAYEESKKLMKYGFIGSIFLSVLLVITSSVYVKIYHVEPLVQEMTREILLVYAVISPVKVQNMILGGGIIRSGGKTKYIMWVDFIGTWMFGVPLALASAFVWKMQITYVYFILSLEECVRFGITLVIFRKRTWMKSLK
ncbi:MAG: MATE family efflux transporter [Eubacteriales bacterium]|nr:MATE family efflux transporter [Eubacteriales bacterium]